MDNDLSILGYKRIPDSSVWLKFLILLGFILVIISIVLSSINTVSISSYLTADELATLENLTNNTSFDAENCLATRCLTDAFVERNARGLQSRAVIPTFTEVDGVIGCVEINISELSISHSGITSSALVQLVSDVSVTKTFQVGAYTTAERLALSPQEGSIVYDSDLGCIAIFQSESWYVLDSTTNVLSVVGTPGEIDVNGFPQYRVVSLSDCGLGAASYTCPTMQIDDKGRCISASSNTYVTSVSVIPGQLVNTSSISNPVLGIDPTLLSSIQFWETMEPTGTPIQNQILQYRSPRLTWQSIGTFPASRNLYVDKSGNDTTGDGSSIFPFLTVKHAIQVALAGNTSLANQVGICVGCGLYVEVNPINITSAGINLLGSSALGTWLMPAVVSQPFFVLSGPIMTVQNCRFECVSGTSSNCCFSLTGVFTFIFQDCLIRFFQTGLQFVGSGNLLSLALVNSCSLVQNNTSCSGSGLTLIVNDTQFTGNLQAVPSSSFNGIQVANNNTILFVSAGCYFIRNGTGVALSNGALGFLSSVNFTYNLTGISCSALCYLNAVSCSFVRMESSHIGVNASGAGCIVKTSSCNTNGLSPTGVVSGTGVLVTGQATVTMLSCSVLNCITGVQVGLNSDSASTMCSCSNSEFFNNTVSIHLKGTSSLAGILVSVDDPATFVFDSTANIQMVYSSPNGSGLSVGTLTNAADIDVIGIGTKLTNSPALIYYPSVYSHEALAFTNPDPLVSSSLGVISQVDAHLDILSTTLNSNTGIHIYTDLSGFDSTQIRGWHIFKDNTSKLSFEYKNNITGQDIVDKTMLTLDSVANEVSLQSSVLAWSGGSSILEVSSHLLETNASWILDTLNASCVVQTASNKQLESSIVTTAELAYLSGVSSSVQSQLDAKIARSGDSMTGALGSSFVGSESNPSFSIGSAGMFALDTNHIDFATNNVNRIDIDEAGIITIFAFGTGVVKSASDGTLSSTLIVDADIDTKTIANDKLATSSSAENPLYIVERDSDSRFAAKMITLSGTTSLSTDVATKAYVDTQVSLGLSVHTAVSLVATSNRGLAGLASIDSIPLTVNMRVLLVGQNNPVENGAWLAQTLSWTRPLDFANGGTASTAYFLVTMGTLFTGSSWVCTTPAAVVGTDPLVFAEFSLPQSVSGANLPGSGQADVFSFALGSTLNFRKISQGSHILVSQTTNDVVIDTDGTSSNILSTLVARDGSGGFSCGTIVGQLTGHASEDLLLIGGTLSGSLTLGGTQSPASPALVVGSAGVGLSATGGALQFSTAGVLRMGIDASGIVSIANLSFDGVVHTNGTALSSSKIVDADITVGTIQNTSLAAISSSNVASKIAVRDINGSFAANIITASLVGNVQGDVVGHASLDVRVAGDTMTGALIAFAGTESAPGLCVGDAKTGMWSAAGGFNISTNSVQALSINSSGTLFLPHLSTGVMHIGSLGVVSVGTVLNSELAGSISNDKLQTLTTALLVSNSATTAVSTNTNNAIVARDGSGGFAAGAITHTSSILVEQASVTTPSAGQLTMFADTSNNLKATDSSAVTRGYLSTASTGGTFDQMVSFNATGGFGTSNSGAAATSQVSLISQLGPVAPAGQRNLWQGVGTGSASGPSMTYSPTFDKVYAYGGTGSGLGRVAYSSTGSASWSECVFNNVSTFSICTMGFSSSKVVALTTGGESYTSTNGINFTQGSAVPGVPQSLNVEWFAAASLFIAGSNVDGTHQIVTSVDGSTWVSRVSSVPVTTIKSNSSMCVAVGASGAIAQSSTDGITWTATASAGLLASKALVWAQEKLEWLFISSANGTGFRSTDGLTWASVGVLTPGLLGDCLIWVANNNYNRYYAASVDTNLNYSLFSSVSSTTAFTGTHLDGATANTGNSLRYDASRDNFYMGIATNVVGILVYYGTPRTFDIKSIGDNIRVRNSPVSVCTYVSTADTTANNTTSQTQIVPSATFLGNYLMQPAFPIGMVLLVDLTLVVTSSAGDTLTIGYYTGGGGNPNLTHVLTIPAASSSLIVNIRTQIIVRASDCRIISFPSLATCPPVVTTGTWPRTTQGLLAIYATWGAALSSCTCVMCTYTTLFRNGA
jgi:hypothetical protein